MADVDDNEVVNIHIDLTQGRGIPAKTAQLVLAIGSIVLGTGENWLKSRQLWSNCQCHGPASFRSALGGSRLPSHLITAFVWGVLASGRPAALRARSGGRMDLDGLAGEVTLHLQIVLGWRQMQFGQDALP
jgi:hypothetical protein